MKLLLLTLPILGLASCASFSTAQQQADYNGDGFVSQAENAQFQRQKNVEDRAVYSESVKRRNVTNTVRDTSDTLYQARRAQSLIKGF
ncbi:hypothetical protein V2O64_06080 [Verrucomicrobiaceae bacterium 227]